MEGAVLAVLILRAGLAAACPVHSWRFSMNDYRPTRTIHRARNQFNRF
jgi:hypothetical protein